jgi:single-stranded-DNA-specific exonuclease
VLASVLVNRGIKDPAAAEHALDPRASDLHPPRRLPDIETAVNRIEAAIELEEDVWIFSDRDVDGITGLTILLTLLQEFDISATPRVPGKWDGYGLSEDAVAEFIDHEVDLLVAVDCGTTAHEAIGQATNGGIDVVVIDHHDPDETLPAMTACVNPRRSDSDYSNPNLAAGALAWKVGQALVETIEPLNIEDFHRKALPLAAVATLGDYMSLTVENRAIIREGYARLEKCDRPGLVQTADHCGVESMRDISWSLVPLLNAAQEAESGELMLELLMERDAVRIETLIERLEAFRTERKQQRSERLAHLEACFRDQVDTHSGMVFFIETEQYVGGGPMSELSDRYYRPVITYRSAEGGYKGGGRTAPDVDLLELYQACDDLLETYWGHPGAAGFRVAEENLTPFKRALRETLRDRYDPDAFRPTIDVDVTVEPTALSVTTVEELDRLGPFGSNHDQPLVLIENVDIAHGEWFGDENAHWKGRLAGTEDVTIIDWNGDTIEPDNELPISCDIAGTLSIDDYMDSVAVTLEALRPTDGPAN